MTVPPATSPADPPQLEPLDRLIARNSTLGIVGRSVYVLGWVLIAPYVLAKLGAERFGLWSLLTVLSGITTTIDLGMSSTLTRFVAEYRATGAREALRGVVTLGALLYGGLSLGFVLLVVLLRDPLLDLLRIGPGIRAEAQAALVLAAVVYGFLNVYMLSASVLGGLHRIDLQSRVSLVVTSLQLLGTWAVLAAGGGVPALFLNTGVALVVGVLLTRREVRRLAPEIEFAPTAIDRGMLGRIARYGAALQIINLGVLLHFQLEKMLYGAMVSLTAVGSYELGLRVVSGLWALPGLLLPPLLPAVAHLDASGDRDRIARLYHRANRYVLAIAFPLSAGLMALSPLLYQSWLGPGHGDAALAATALAAMLGVNILTGVGTAIARGMGRPGLEVRYQVLAMVLHVCFSTLLIRRYGYVGGLWGLFLSISIASLYFVVLFHRVMRLPLGEFVLRIVLPPLLAAAAGGLLAWWSSGAGNPGIEAWSRPEVLTRLLAGSVVLGLVVIGALLASRYLRWSELRDLGLLLRGRPSAGSVAA
jgi:O-antigen/teichoic acid export membrane protein